jgi:hypothetical protein
LNTIVTPYVMNPAEDYLLFGDDIADGMWVLIEDESLRGGFESSEDQCIRGQRFARVTHLRREGEHIRFIAEYVDGFQRSRKVHTVLAWIVKRDTAPSPDAELREMREQES